jgi:branched-subunit amino acid aminotransferase/4-amino-4-deoxychorismate lyase
MFVATLEPGPPTIKSVQKLAVAPSPVSSKDPALGHKTNQRLVYVQAKGAVTKAYGEEIEPLLVNERGEVTETDIANVVYVLDGQNYTPPAGCGPVCYANSCLGAVNCKSACCLQKISRAWTSST